VRDYFHDVESLEQIDRKALLDRARKGEVVVVDVRPREEYDAGHIAGAVSIPLTQLEQHISEIDPAQEIIAYCRGPYCVLAAEAVKTMRKRGYRAFRLVDGYPEWRDAGLPIETKTT
jgi:ArsR family transcriptional regulator